LLILPGTLIAVCRNRIDKDFMQTDRVRMDSGNGHDRRGCRKQVIDPFPLLQVKNDPASARFASIHDGRECAEEIGIDLPVHGDNHSLCRASLLLYGGDRPLEHFLPAVYQQDTIGQAFNEVHLMSTQQHRRPAVTKRADDIDEEVLIHRIKPGEWFIKHRKQWCVKYGGNELDLLLIPF